MNYFLLATVFLQTTEPVGVPPWVPIVIAVILLLLFWWGLSRNSIPQGSDAHEDDHEGDHEPHEPAVRNEPHAAHHEEMVAEPTEAARSTAVPLSAAPESVEPDDLKIIEGVGPKIEGILHDAGIHTFADLAAAGVDELEKIVREDAGIRIAIPDTWPEQAQLAADGKWAELEKLQDELKGGRHA